jgi:hypothetical protein
VRLFHLQSYSRVGSFSMHIYGSFMHTNREGKPRAFHCRLGLICWTPSVEGTIIPVNAIPQGAINVNLLKRQFYVRCRPNIFDLMHAILIKSLSIVKPLYRAFVDFPSVLPNGFLANCFSFHVMDFFRKSCCFVSVYAITGSPIRLG